MKAWKLVHVGTAYNVGLIVGGILNAVFWFYLGWRFGHAH